MKEIGGFLGLENVEKATGPFIHADAVSLNVARASFNYVLKYLKPSKIYIPYYTCDALLEPVKSNKIKSEFYSIDSNFNINSDIALKEGEYLLYVNYFGIKSDTVRNLADEFKDNLIVDNAQAFFEPEIKNVVSFNSARKFFGVPDGSFLYMQIAEDLEMEENRAISTNHLINRAIGNTQDGYDEFLLYEESIGVDVKKISSLSYHILHKVNYNKAAKARRTNFNFLDKHLRDYNEVQIELQPGMVPLCYPFLPRTHIDKRDFFKENIFIPTYWNEVIYRREGTFDLEKEIAVS